MSKFISALTKVAAFRAHKKALFYGTGAILALLIIYLFSPDPPPPETGCIPLLGMAGSRKWFVYFTDAGKPYALNLDESNTEALNAGNNDIPDNVEATTEAVPRNIRPRTVTYKSADGKRTIKCVALTPTVYSAVEVTVGQIDDPLTAGQKLSLYSKTAEKVRVVRGIDTGLTDGDAT